MPKKRPVRDKQTELLRGRPVKPVAVVQVTKKPVKRKPKQTA